MTPVTTNFVIAHNTTILEIIINNTITSFGYICGIKGPTSDWLKLIKYYLAVKVFNVVMTISKNKNLYMYKKEYSIFCQEITYGTKNCD